LEINLSRIPERHVAAAREILGPLVHGIDGHAVVSRAAAEVLARRGRRFRDLARHPVDAKRWSETRGRLHAFWAALVSEPLPECVEREARLVLYADPALELEFMGRGRIHSERHLPAASEFLLHLDRPGGQRTYLFRRLQDPANSKDARMLRNEQRFVEWQGWLSDPDARVVLSIGGGGFRLFAAMPVLKAIDRLAGSRTRISEVWGSSGGAFLGYAYAAGFPLGALDEFAFDLYNDRVPHLVSGSVASIVKTRVRAAVLALRGREPPPDMVDWLAELHRRYPVPTRLPARPFYAIASSSERAGLTALAAEEHVSKACSDFMVACAPHLGVAASTAVPFVLRPVRGIGDQANERWFDGSISDENPLALPYVKWLRERELDPTVPKKLKIVLVNLNLRASESELLRAVGNLPIVRHLELVDHGGRVVDMLLDSKTTTTVRLVTATPGVEVLHAKLNLGWLNAQNPREIAKAVRSGRTLESWQITIHGGASSVPAVAAPS
jgi:predicted acylesterase/phospholipase RssA